jgi:hypothetical protein
MHGEKEHSVTAAEGLSGEGGRPGGGVRERCGIARLWGGVSGGRRRRGSGRGPGRGEVEEDRVGARGLVVEREAAVVHVTVRHAHDASEPVLGDLAAQDLGPLFMVLEAEHLAERVPLRAGGRRGGVAGEDGARGRVREGAGAGAALDQPASGARAEEV